MNGPTSLDYTVLFHQMDRMRLCDADYDQLFADIQVIEAEALTILRPQKA